MARFIDPFHYNNFVDANILDDVADGEDAAVNEIVGLEQTGKIILLPPYSVQNELKRPNTPAHVQRAATLFLFSMQVGLTEVEQRRYSSLVAAVKGDAKEKNIAPDLFHVFEAAKHGGGYFITHDKRLLARSEAISTELQIDVVTPMVFLERIAESRQRAMKFGRR